MHTNELRRINDYRGLDRIYTVDDLRPFKGVFWNAVIVAVLACLVVVLLALGQRSLETDSYARGNYAQPQCWPRAGDWPPHGDDCE